ncbi:MAG: short chain dehydrogenase family protein, partial [Gammaproteobacteria bacterium]|nr:short chain dehydrogenase family protein [Gammaproteobacteria bacterium]
MTQQLEGKVAIITGGASGIGLASVESFIEEGARVVVADIQDEAGAALETKFKNELLYVRTDVSDDDAVKGLVQRAVDRFGKLDVMFNNAGAGGDFAAFVELSPGGLDRTLALLTRAVHAGHKYAALQFMKQGSGGSIITTASAASFEGGWSAAAYTIAKHAVIGIVRAAVAELSPLGIRANAICPGVIMTPIMASAFGVPKERSDEFIAFLSARFAAFHPIGR